MPATRHTGRAPALLAIAGLCAIAMTGCEVDDTRRGAPTIGALLRPVTPLEAAEMALNLEDADKRARGTRLLANAPFGSDDIYRVMYRDYLDDEAPLVRASAARALGNHGDPSDAERIAGMLRDPSPIVQLDAAYALQRLHNIGAIDALVSRLTPDQMIEEDADIRSRILVALGQYRSGRVAEAVIPLVSDRSLRVAHAARETLSLMTGQDFGLDRRAWSAWYTGASDPFAAGGRYVYPVFERDQFLVEYIPFVPKPPNETPSEPVGIRAAEGG